MDKKKKKSSPAPLRRPAPVSSRSWTDPVAANNNSTNASTSSSLAASSNNSLALDSSSNHSFRPSLFHGGANLSCLPDYPTNNNTNRPFVSGVAPPRPRRLWRVSDTSSLRQRSCYEPPLNRHCSCCISSSTSLATTPSIVAVRIAECLRRRSVAVEYDEEAATATAMTIDRCHLTIHLWRGVSTTTTANSSSMAEEEQQSTTTTTGDAAAAVLVECVRIRGSLVTFHLTVKAVLDAAQGLDSGVDRRPPLFTSPLEYPRFVISSSSYSSSSSSSSSSKKKQGGRRLLLALPTTKTANALNSDALQAMEQSLLMLRKDRLEAQQLGMERLVGLTDAFTSGLDTALYTALAVLGAPIIVTTTNDDATVATVHSVVEEIHKVWIIALLVDRMLPGEAAEDKKKKKKKKKASTPESSFSFSCATSLLGDEEARLERLEAAMGAAAGGGASQQQQQPKTTVRVVSGDEHHSGNMRSMALRAFTNALTVLAEKQPKILESVLSVQAPQLISAPVLDALIEDVHGASRPPAVVARTCLASPHEAVLAIRCLRILGTHSEKAKRRIVTEQTLGLLEKARFVGQSTHVILEEEAKLCYQQLTEDERSC